MTLPPVSAGVQQAEARGRHQDSAPPSVEPGTEPFAGLLASLLQEEEAGGGGASPSIDPGALPHQRAKVFNADGFFPEGGLRDGRRVADGVLPAADGNGFDTARPTDSRTLVAEISGSEELLHERPPEPAGLTGHKSTGLLQGSPARSPLPNARPVASGRASAAAQEMQGLPTALETPGEAPLASEAGEGAPIRQRSTVPRDAPRREGSTLQAQLSLEAAGAEASLVARVQSLTREERARLRLEVIALLARYGLSAGEIRLNGEAEPIAKLEREGD